MDTGTVLTVRLPEGLAKIVEDAVANGWHASADEVVSAALIHYAERQLEDGGLLKAIGIDDARRLWDEGLASGPSKFLDMHDIKREARQRLTARRTAQR